MSNCRTESSRNRNRHLNRLRGCLKGKKKKNYLNFWLNIIAGIKVFFFFFYYEFFISNLKFIYGVIILKLLLLLFFEQYGKLPLIIRNT